MREIKFKIWNNASGQWADKNSFELLQSEKENTYSFRNYLVNNEPDGEVKYILCQFTGLKDKNGKEIYEGDVIYWPHLEKQNNEVYFNQKEAAFYGRPIEGDDKTESYLGGLAEVIGNIYSNPELLKTA